VRIGRLMGIPVRLSPLALPMMALALWLGEGRRMLVMSASILVHELFHAGAAHLLRIRVVELEIMPCGGAARLENLWRLRAGQMMIVALAGPLANLLLMTFCAALCRWSLMPPDWAALAIEQNAVIFAFNMLPALPMDGGRVLCGMISRRLSPAAAARVGMIGALALSCALMCASVVGFVKGRLNITLPMAALFLLLSARSERRQSESCAIESLSARRTELEDERVMPLRWLAVGYDATVREAAVCLRPRYMHMLAVYDKEMNLCAVVEERALIGALMHNADMQMGEFKEDVNSKKVEKTY